MKNNLEIYIHIPFCVKKCDYCDFLSFSCCSDTEKAEYVEALIRELEIKSGSYKDYYVSTVFIGGGTPSSLDAKLIEAIMIRIKQCYNFCDNVEITIEANPGTITKDKLITYKACGINRLSIGLQSTDNSELKLLGRIHDYETFVSNYQLARECGFDNINVDLISSVPSQTLDSFRETLEKVINLKPEHISAYSLIIEEGTPYWDRYGDENNCVGVNTLPSEDDERAMYELTMDMLKSAGYMQYEISNYAKEGYECKHNLGYWIRENYLGIGLGASSMIGDVRWKNTSDMSAYCSKDYNYERCEEELLSEDDIFEEVIFLGLRMTQGVDINTVNAIGNRDILSDCKEWIDKMIAEELLEISEGRIRLTRKGRSFEDYVVLGFMEA